MVKPAASRVNFAIVSIAVLCLTAAAPGQSGTEERIKVKTFVGSVETRSGGSNTWRPVRIGMPLRSGWDIRTFVESTAELEYETGSVIRVGENSVITLTSLKKSADAQSTESGVKVGTGQVWANVKKLAGAKSKFEFETPTAVASIRGTRLGVGVNEGRTSIDVYEGLVMVRNKGSGREVPVGTRNRAIIEPGQPNVQLLEFSADSGGGSSMQDPFVTDSAAVSPDSTQGGTDTTGATQPADTTSGAPRDTTGRDSTRTDSAKVGAASGSPADTGKARPGADSARSAQAPMRLDILSPAANAVVTQTPVLVRGKTHPGSSVVVGSRTAAVGPDGAFSSLVDLSAGVNSISIAARYGDRSKTVELSVSYQPPLTLSVSNLYDNMEVIAEELVLDIEVSEGALYSVNGKTGVNRVTLVAGRNVVTVVAWNQFGGRQERSFTVNYRKATSFELKVISPRDGDTVRKPMIPVSGSTVAGAAVTVNKANVPVTAGGFFSYQAPIANEPQEYVIEISARMGDQEKTESRRVIFAPPLEPMQLVVTSPVEGQAISARILRVAGKTGAGGTVRVNGRSAAVTARGVFMIDLPLTERDIGELVLDIQAIRGDEEMNKAMTVKIDLASAQINTSAPKLVVSGLSQQATRQSQAPVQVYDMTPGDVVTLTVQNSGMTEQFTLESGGRESIALNEGKNDLTIRATDRAGNVSNVVQASLYYLPGPLVMDIVDPADNPVVVNDRPPLPRRPGLPRIVPQIRFRVELDDGIGNVPETIKYCRVSSSLGQTVLLRQERPYVYTGELQLPLGSTIFTIQTEDLAGNTVFKRVEARISE